MQLPAHLGPRDVGRDLVDGVQQLLDGRGDLLDRLQEGFPVGDLVRNPAQDPLQVRRLPVQLLERQREQELGGAGEGAGGAAGAAGGGAGGAAGAAGGGGG